MGRGMMDGARMEGAWGMGSGMLAMLGGLLVLVAATVVLVLLLRRVVASDPAERIRAGVLRRLDLAPATQGKHPAGPPGGEVDGFLVIPDISGYTQFMQLSAFALAHAQYVVSALLTAVIEAAEDTLATAKIEGDAVFLYGVHMTQPGQGGLTGPEVGAAVGALLRAFYRKRAELSAANTCRCETCRRLDSLDLKTVVHSGRLLLYDLRGQRELSGLPVIVAHRLLKSDIGLERYVLVSDAAGGDVTLPLEAERWRHTQAYDGVGRIESTVYAFGAEAFAADEVAAAPGVSAKAADAARKLADGLRGLRVGAGRG